ncbi:6-phospho-3-hexuloisomerase [Paenibacillus nasutitermitis]|uniref:3-hexulose-6-phosphate isomerase n=1 Tax=Paenibacillus nasutitermitis TaxID=1652958 RepID=A0A916YKV7_9BACL|nr:6-phospho-3-hexuloisomerase [Paenibacillus nasutitermitis]GGD48581.1 3-hexulose-6-phosphate isomerase [Paenibacillus nasutitermitis]
MGITLYTDKIITELSHCLKGISAEAVDQLAGRIIASEKIFVAGAGRSGLMMKALAMRLMHMGYSAHVVGETTTPGISRDDVLIIGSGSGETASLLSMVRKAKAIGASVAVATISADSSIGALSDIVVRIPASSKEQTDSGAITAQPMGSLFEQSLLLLSDALILSLMDRQKLDSSKMFGNHANLE